jgi:putative Mn2+ efflux pump MntP
MTYCWTRSTRVIFWYNSGEACMTPWTKLASTIVLGISANVENLPVGLAYGLRGVPIGLARNLAIAVVTTVATLLPLMAGRGLRGYFPPEVPDIVAGLLLVGLGFFNIWIERRKAGEKPEGPLHWQAKEKPLDLRETLVLAGALSINNVGLGFAGGFAGLDHGPVALSVGGFSILLLWLGEWLSRVVAFPLNSRFSWLRLDGNLMIVGIGILVLFGL